MRFALNAAAVAACVVALPADARIASVSFGGTGVVTDVYGRAPQVREALGLPVVVSGGISFSDGSNPDGDAELPSDYTGVVHFRETGSYSPGYNLFGFSVYAENGYGGGGQNVYAISWTEGTATIENGVVRRFEFLWVDDPAAGYLSNRYFSVGLHIFGEIAGVWMSDNYPFDSSVPEPTSWAMMIGGIGLMGGALRRRRQPSPHKFGKGDTREACAG